MFRGLKAYFSINTKKCSSKAISLSAWALFALSFIPFLFCLVLPKSEEPNAAALTPSREKRIISTSLASDEILWGLLSHEHTTEQIVGVSYLVDDPSISNIPGHIPTTIARVGLDPEKLTLLRPTHIILASYNNSKLISIAQALGVKTLLLQNFDSLSDISRNIDAIAHFLGLNAETAIHLNSQLRQQLSSAQKTPNPGHRLPKPEALLINPDFTTTGRGTIVHEIIERAGFTNYAAIAKLFGWQKVSPEFLLKANPEFLIVNKSWKAEKARPQWLASLFQNRRILFYEEHEVYSASQFVVSAISHLSCHISGSCIKGNTMLHGVQNTPSPSGGLGADPLLRGAL